MIFLNSIGGGLHDEGERRAGVLLPDGEIFTGNREPTKREKVPARFGNSPNLSPGDLVYFGIDHVARPADSTRKKRAEALFPDQ
jgi:hypothetical protein